MPQISVIMPVYNGERFLQQAVDSILTQTFKDFELIIIDDGSSDRSPEIIEAYRKNDPRIRVHRQPRNMGLVEALNTGCRLATGEYIARMDADDICLPERFAKQVQYLDANPQVGFVGTWVKYIDAFGKNMDKAWQPPITPILTRWTLMFCSSPLAHPSWLFRRSIINRLKFYRPVKVEDYELLVRASEITELANIPEILLEYRSWNQSKSSVNSAYEKPEHIEIMKFALSNIVGLAVTTQKATNVQKLLTRTHNNTQADDIREFCEMLHETRIKYIEKYKIKGVDLQSINLDAALKLLIVAGSNFQRQPKLSLMLIFGAIKLHYLSPLFLGVKFIRGLFG